MANHLPSYQQPTPIYNNNPRRHEDTPFIPPRANVRQPAPSHTTARPPRSITERIIEDHARHQFSNARELNPIALDRAIRNLVGKTNSLIYALGSLKPYALHQLQHVVAQLHVTLHDERLWNDQTHTPALLPIGRVLWYRLSANGLDYYVQLVNNQYLWIRDVGMPDFAGGVVEARRFWEVRQCVLSLEELKKIVDLPQYLGRDGDTFRDMKINAEDRESGNL